MQFRTTPSGKRYPTEGHTYQPVTLFCLDVTQEQNIRNTGDQYSFTACHDIKDRGTKADCYEMQGELRDDYVLETLKVWRAEGEPDTMETFAVLVDDVAKLPVDLIHDGHRILDPETKQPVEIIMDAEQCRRLNVLINCRLAVAA